MFNSPSLANCDLTRLDEQLNEMSAGGVDFFHIDLIDGHYVNNLGFPPRIISDIKKDTRKSLRMSISWLRSPSPMSLQCRNAVQILCAFIQIVRDLSFVH